MTLVCPDAKTPASKSAMHAHQSALTPAEPTWSYTQHGETYGPVSFAELQAAARLGFVRRGDLVRQQGGGAWLRAGTVPDLFRQDLFSKEGKIIS